MPFEYRIGEIFWKDGAYWMCEKVEHDSNATFRWQDVTASWSELGPRPRFADSPHKFGNMFRERHTNSH